MGLQDVERYLKKHSKQPRIMQDLDMIPTRLPKTPSSKQTSQPGVFIKYRPVALSSIDAPKSVNPQHLTAHESDGIVVERKPFITDKPTALKFQSGSYYFPLIFSKTNLIRFIFFCLAQQYQHLMSL